jgi:hypothetical protein
MSCSTVQAVIRGFGCFVIATGIIMESSWRINRDKKFREEDYPSANQDFEHEYKAKLEELEREMYKSGFRKFE